MKHPKPLLHTTRANVLTKEWLPTSFKNFLAEVNHLKSVGNEDGALMLYRGQKRREWLLDSTFVRSCKSIIFGIPVEQKLKGSLVESSNYHHALVALYLLKFSEIVQPSAELYALEKSEGIDAWFELLKRMQQHSEIDKSAIKGSNFVDWSASSDIALYFANEGRDGEGAVYVCDASSTGKTIPLKSVDEVLNLMAEIVMKERP